MTTRLPGKSQSQFANRNVDELRCICYERGDRAVFVDGKGPYCLIIDREYEKIEIEDVGINSSTIEAVWVEADCLPIRKKSTLQTGGYEFKVRNEPVADYAGWMSATIQLTCKC